MTTRHAALSWLRIALADEGDLAYDCTCPRAADGYFCKHCVAVGLAWLAEQAAETKPMAGKAKRRDPWRDIKEYLTAQAPENLIELLLDATWLAAHSGACDRNLPITLAGKLESARPDDAISLYRRVAPPIVEQTNNTAYDEAIKLIRQVGGLMKTQKQLSQFGDYLAELRV